MPRIHVAGSLNMDLIVEVGRQPKPGETIFGRSLKTLPGGKGANQALAAARAGAPVTLIGKVGADAFGGELRRYLAAAEVEVHHVSTDESAPTGTAVIVVDGSGENSIIVVPGANERLLPNEVLHLPLGPSDIGLCQFETPLPTIERLFRRCRQIGARTILNVAPFRPDCSAILELSDVLVANEPEFRSLLGGESLGESSAENLVRAAEKLRTHSEQGVVVTLGSRGVVAVDGTARVVLPGWAVPTVDTTGAGDAFTGSLAARLLAGDALESALAYANAAAAISVQRPGAGPSIPTHAEVERFLAERRGSFSPKRG